MKWEDVDVMRIYMKSGAVFQYYGFSHKIDPNKLLYSISDMVIFEINHNTIFQSFKSSEIESIEFEVKHGS